MHAPQRFVIGHEYAGQDDMWKIWLSRTMRGGRDSYIVANSRDERDQYPVGSVWSI